MKFFSVNPRPVVIVCARVIGTYDYNKYSVVDLYWKYWNRHSNKVVSLVLKMFLEDCAD